MTNFIPKPRLDFGIIGDLTQGITSVGNAVGNALLPGSNLNDQQAQANSTRYPSSVERWRADITRIFQQIGGDKFNPQDVDKALWVINYESSGNPTIMGDGGHAVGLFQHNDGGLASGRSLDALKDPIANITLAAQAIYGGQGWTPWGEGALYNGKPFGALGNHPYPGGYQTTSGQSLNFSVENPGGTSQASTYRTNASGMPLLTYADILEQAGGDHAYAIELWTQYQAALSASEDHDINDALTYLEAVSAELANDIAAQRLTLDQANSAFKNRLDAFTAGQQAVQNLIPYTIPRDASGNLMGFGPGSIGETLGMAPPTPSYSMPDPFAMAMSMARTTPSMSAPQGTLDLSASADAMAMVEQALGIARNQTSTSTSFPNPTQNVGFGAGYQNRYIYQ